VVIYIQIYLRRKNKMKKYSHFGLILTFILVVALSGCGGGNGGGGNPPHITTIAGTGTSGYNEDNISATSAQLNAPYGVAVDSEGNIYIADTDNHRIRKVDSSGVITTIAGSEGAGSSGDGGSATSAKLGNPHGVAVDSDGNIYIADSGNQRIRKVDSFGVITNFAGTGSAGHNGDGSPATSRQLNFPHGVAVDSGGNIYIADRDNHLIRKVYSSGGIMTITTIAGTPKTDGFGGDGGPSTSAQLNFPYGVAVDSVGNIYIADSANHRIRKVDSSGGIMTITTIAGTGTAGYSGDRGPATSAQLYFPTGVAVDSVGNIYIADYGNHRIRKVYSSGGIMTITTIAGTGEADYSGDGGPSTSAKLNCPSGVTVDSGGNIYIADYGNHRIRKIKK
jgi:sugar lactone lactonase YvrE